MVRTDSLPDKAAKDKAELVARLISSGRGKKMIALHTVRSAARNHQVSSKLVFEGLKRLVADERFRAENPSTARHMLELVRKFQIIEKARSQRIKDTNRKLALEGKFKLRHTVSPARQLIKAVRKKHGKRV